MVGGGSGVGKKRGNKVLKAHISDDRSVSQADLTQWP